MANRIHWKIYALLCILLGLLTGQFAVAGKRSAAGNDIEQFVSQVIDYLVDNEMLDDQMRNDLISRHYQPINQIIDSLKNKDKISLEQHTHLTNALNRIAPKRSDSKKLTALRNAFIKQVREYKATSTTVSTIQDDSHESSTPAPKKRKTSDLSESDISETENPQNVDTMSQDPQSEESSTSAPTTPFEPFATESWYPFANLRSASLTLPLTPLSPLDSFRSTADPQPDSLSLLVAKTPPPSHPSMASCSDSQSSLLPLRHLLEDVQPILTHALDSEKNQLKKSIAYILDSSLPTQCRELAAICERALAAYFRKSINLGYFAATSDESEP